MFELVATCAGAAATGWGLARLRPDLDLSPRATAAWSAALASCAGLGLLAVGRGGEASALFAGLAPLAVIDARRRILPNEGTALLISLGLCLGALGGMAEAVDRLIGAAAGYGALWALGALWRRWRGVDALGLGDAKLLAGVGAFLGWRALPEVALIGALTGVAAALAFGRGAEREIPFGPALAFGALVFVAAGPLLP